MEQPKFQWAVFNADRSQQWVVRAETFAEFLTAVTQMTALLPAEYAGTGTAVLSEAVPAAAAVVGDAPAVAEPPPTNGNGEAEQPTCPLHHKQMTLRTGKSGQWYDHRWQENGLWMQCNGKQVRSNNGSVASK